MHACVREGAGLRRVDTPASQGPELRKVIQGHLEPVLGSRAGSFLRKNYYVIVCCASFRSQHHTFCFHYPNRYILCYAAGLQTSILISTFPDTNW
ncbi:hypothetical protein X975_14247, partial [Stegodyphus mimosarum]